MFGDKKDRQHTRGALSDLLLLLLTTFFARLSFVSMSTVRTGRNWLTVGVRFAFTLGVVCIGLIGNLCDGT